MSWLGTLILVLDYAILTYLIAFAIVNIALLVLAYRQVRRQLRVEHVRPAAAAVESAFLPVITLLVPAYNEELTIVQSVRSLLRLSYPAYEIIICNDGSKDRTVEVLKQHFPFVSRDVEHADVLGTAKVRAIYEMQAALPPGVRRLVLIDKDNGGKADALNAAINAAEGDYVTSMDADSLLVPDALLRAAQAIGNDPEGTVGVGAQVGLSNGATVDGGRIVELRLPRTWIARFQVVEYMRSFVQGRTALSSLNSVLILSGAFSLLRRDLVLEVGGFLTKHMRHRIGLEYCGPAPHTVCEDMEIVVRLHRYLRDKGLPGRIVSLPFPVAWTEAPEVYRDLGKQRARWYRGLLEVLRYHRPMLLRPRFGQVGMFSAPYQVVFEAAAPVVELCGYLMLLVTGAMGLLSAPALVVFLTFAGGINLLLSSWAILLCFYSERGSGRRSGVASLFPDMLLSDVIRMLFASVVANFGYRQFLVAWQLRGLWDYLKGKTTWDKFARRGFNATATGAPAGPGS